MRQKLDLDDLNTSNNKMMKQIFQTSPYSQAESALDKEVLLI